MAELDVPAGMSLIARTAGIGCSVEELQWDFAPLSSFTCKAVDWVSAVSVLVIDWTMTGESEPTLT